MNKNIFPLLLSIGFFTQSFALEVGRMTCEMSVNPMAVENVRPRFGWQLESDINNTSQSAYALEVFVVENGKQTSYWNSGRIESAKSQFVDYTGPELKPALGYQWKVQVWDQDGKPSAWSETAGFRVAPDRGFLDSKWIGAISHEDAKMPQGRNFTGAKLKDAASKAEWDAVDSIAKKSIILRNSFRAGKKVTDATAYVCGLGFYEFTLNGSKVGESEFAPLWTDYDKTVYYNVYDVTSMVRRGENVAGIMLGNGFYNVHGGRYRKLQISFGAPTLFFKMVINYADGTSEVVRSDENWKYSLSPVTFNCIYGGEDYDARLEQKGWDKPGFDDSSWAPVVVQSAPKGNLTAQQADPVKIMERYGVKDIRKLSPDECEKACKSMKRQVDNSAMVLDMGQNLAGFPEITVKGRKGQTVTLIVAEALTAEGAVNQRQTGRQHYYKYTLKGNGTERWHPRFSYYGYRYLQVEGAVMEGDANPSKLPVISNVESCFVYNSAPKRSEFKTSNEIFNSAHRIIEKAVRSNMQAVFTDCPHREKLGWLEQVHLNGPGLLFNYDLTTYAPKILQDMADAQQTNGMVPTVAPLYVVFEGKGMTDFADSPEWGSSLVILPFMYYEYYGDNSLISKYYRNMRAYVDYLTTRADNHIVSHGLGDWYDYGDFKAGFSRNTPVPLVATAHYYMDILYVAKAAEMVGNTHDKAYYDNLAAKVKDAFNEMFFDRNTCQYGSGSQCSNALPLFLEMVEPEKRYKVLNNLVDDVRKHGDRLTTGDVGNRYLFQTLARNGLNELMYRMHNHEDAPGYGFQLKFGATTLTEQWDPRQGSSWNHFMMGQIDEWFFTSLAGISQQGNGMTNLVIRPQVVGDLESVDVTTENLYGKVGVKWSRSNGTLQMEVNVPVGCQADVYVHGEETPRSVGSGKHEFSTPM